MTDETENGQTTVEPVQEDRLAKLEAELDEQRKSLDEERRRAQSLSGKLTQAQQDLAETTRFMRSTLPDLRKVWEEKSFADKWEESPELTVHSAATEAVKPVSKELDEIRMKQKALEAESALVALMAKDPSLAAYESRVRALGFEYPNLTENPKGIEKLFKLAKAEDVDVKAKDLQDREKKVTSSEMADKSKDRAYTEGSVPTSRGGGPGLTSEERRIAKMLRVSEGDYRAMKNRADRGAPTNWKPEGRAR